MRDERNHSLLAHNTFGINVRCNRFLEYDTVREAQEVASLLREAQEAFMTIGSGSNLLLTQDFQGTVVHANVKGITLTEHHGEAIVRCGSGERWDDVVRWTVEQGFTSLACLSIIPGETGAAAVQNIGAYGSEAAQFIDHLLAVEIATGRQVRISAAECRYGYRDSRFKHEWKNRYLITHVALRLQRSAMPSLDYGNIRQELERRALPHPTAQELRQTIIDIRRSKLPDPEEDVGNAGSFFMNPVVDKALYTSLLQRHPQMPHYPIDEQHEKIPAAWLIDQCGWKGRSLGPAGVWAKQALVLVNLGGATGPDIVALCQAIQKDVKDRFGIELEPEVNIV